MRIAAQDAWSDAKNVRRTGWSRLRLFRRSLKDRTWDTRWLFGVSVALGRICRGIELDPLYVDTAIRRWQSLTGRDAVRISDGKLFRELEAEKEQEDER